MVLPAAYPFEAVAVKKYKSPHKNDLSFAKGDRIRVTATAPKDEDDDDDDEDEDDDTWLVGESLDGTKSGTFPASHVQEAPARDEVEPEAPVSAAVAAATTSKPAVEAAAAEAPGTGTNEPTHTPAVADTPAAFSDLKGTRAPETITEDAELKDVDEKLDQAAADPTQDVEKEATTAPAPAPASSDSSAAGSTATRKQSGGPPPAAPKPSGLAARIAAFNKPAEGPPPLPRGKPGAWKKPAAPPPAAAPVKPVSVPQTSESEVAAASTDDGTPSDSQASKVNSGFSAADAQSSIKMSLKERMAALQRGGSDGGAPGSSPAESKPRAPPKPAPGRISEDKRAAAMSSFGTAEQVTSPNEEGSEPAPVVATQQTGGSMASLVKEPPLDKPAEDDAANANEDVEAPRVDDVVQAEEATEAAARPDEEKTEEEVESERRAAIAKRMAALGGRRMGGGPALFGAPAPPGPKPQRKPTGSSAEGEAAPEQAAPSGDAAAVSSTLEPAEEEPTTSGATLAVPRRAAPPRKKKSSASASSVPAASEPIAEANTEDTPVARQDSSLAEGEDAGAKEGQAEDSDVKRIATAAVVGAGAGSVLTDEEHMTAEPVQVEEARRGSVDNTDNATMAVHQPPSLREPPQQESAEPTEDDRVGGAPVQEEEEDDYMKVRAPSSKGTDSFVPTTPLPQGELDERTRQLEAFVRPQEEDDAEAHIPEPQAPAEADTAPEMSEDVPQRSAIASPPPPSAAPPRPPSARPPSTRPPVPKTPVIPSGDDEGDGGVEQPPSNRISSPPPARPPPIPQSSMRQASIGEGGEEASAGMDKASLGGGAAALAGVAAAGAGAAAVIAPKPRAAVPQDFSDDEEDEASRPIASEEPETLAERMSIPESAPVAEMAAGPGQQEEPVDEEDSERMRRARLAERMARMGAQPIMGAPMPFRKKSVPVAEPEEDEANTAAISNQEAEVNDTLTEADDSEKQASGAPTKDVVAADRSALASPPPNPVSPPPAIARRQGSISGQSMTKGASSSGGSITGEAVSLQRDGSVRSRPPVPMTQYSAQGPDEDDDPAPLRSPMSPPPKAPMSPAPRAPMSPAPRAPMSPPPRAPPQRPAVPVQDMMVQDEEEGSAPTQQNAALAPAAPVDVAADVPVSASASTLKGVQPSAPSARDLDLMPSSQWWRHGLPVKLPPTLMRPDVVPTVSVQDEGRKHLIRVDLLFEDYSSTIVTVLYQDDDAAEEYTELSQQHRFAPGRPSTQQLQQWSQQYGSAIAKQASVILAAKGNAPIFGDGTSRGFVTALVAFSTNEGCLPPVGSSFGAILLAQAATTVVDSGADEIRPGDIVALHGADFKGKRGLASYHATYGSANNPTYACVVESDVSSSSKKRKLRCILVGGSATTSNNSNTRPEETSLRLDDVRSGLLRVFRVAPREGWLPNA